MNRHQLEVSFLLSPTLIAPSVMPVFPRNLSVSAASCFILHHSPHHPPHGSLPTTFVVVIIFVVVFVVFVVAIVVVVVVAGPLA